MLLIFMRFHRIFVKIKIQNKPSTVNRVVRGSQSCSRRVSHSVAVCFRSVGPLFARDVRVVRWLVYAWI